MRLHRKNGLALTTRELSPNNPSSPPSPAIHSSQPTHASARSQPAAASEYPRTARSLFARGTHPHTRRPPSPSRRLHLARLLHPHPHHRPRPPHRHRPRTNRRILPPPPSTEGDSPGVVGRA